MIRMKDGRIGREAFEKFGRGKGRKVRGTIRGVLSCERRQGFVLHQRSVITETALGAYAS